VYKNPDGTYSYTEPRQGTFNRSQPGPVPPGTKPAGDYHTHGAPDPAHPEDEDFSNYDKDTLDDPVSNPGLQPGYLGTPTAKIKKHIPRPGKPRKGPVTLIYKREQVDCP